VSCKLCKTLRPKALSRLNTDLATGQKSLASVADKYELPLKAVVRHAKRCLAEDRLSGHATLSKILTQVVGDIEQARDDYKYADGEQSKGAAMLYGSLVKEARELVMSLNRLRPNDAIADDLLVTVINPLLNAMAEALIQEGGGLKRDLQSTLGPHYTQHVDAVLKEAWKRIAARFKVEASKINPLLSQVLERDHGTSRKETAEPTKQSLLSASSSPQIH
jgi:hypothetical protein